MKLSEYIQRIIDQRKQLVEMNKREIQKLEPQAQAYEKEFQQISMQLTKPIVTQVTQQTIKETPKKEIPITKIDTTMQSISSVIQKEISGVKEISEKPKIEEKTEEKSKDIIQQIIDAIISFLRGLGLNV
jgi:seryl-tRNA synthetase